jgi:hypothetical protein
VYIYAWVFRRKDEQDKEGFVRGGRCRAVPVKLEEGRGMEFGLVEWQRVDTQDLECQGEIRRQGKDADVPKNMFLSPSSL